MLDRLQDADTLPRGGAAARKIEAVGKESFGCTGERRTSAGEDRLQMHRLPYRPSLDVLGTEVGGEVRRAPTGHCRIDHDCREPAVGAPVVVRKQPRTWYGGENLGIALPQLAPSGHDVV